MSATPAGSARPRCSLGGRRRPLRGLRDVGGNLIIDGAWFTDQFAGLRLTEAGLIIADPPGGPNRLTASGRALLEAA
jgi:hypothetical protein